MAKDIKYLNKDFASFKDALIEYAKAYYPTAYNDFTTASPGTMFMDMASYVGDVLSFYLDNQIQETFLEYAKQPANLYTMAYMLGYRPKVTSAAIVNLDVYQQVPAVGYSYSPDFNYALIIAEGMEVNSTTSANGYFYVPSKIDFSVSSSFDPTDISVYTTSGGNPASYLLKKTVKALSGQTKTATLTFGAAQRFSIQTINDSNIIEILNVYDSSGNRWYEVPYLAQDYILNAVDNIAANYPALYQEANQVPYILEKMAVPMRFVSRVKNNSSLELEFGAGVNTTPATELVPDPFNVGIGTVNGLDLFYTAFDSTNFVSNETYGLAPSNTTLTVTYLAGGGATANVQTGELTQIVNSSAIFAGATNPSIAPTYLASLATSNATPAIGGGDGDTTEQLRLNIAASFPSQMRAVTQQDYLGFALGMPGKFGQVAKAYITKDSVLFGQYQSNQPGERDPIAVSLYALGFNQAGHLDALPSALVQNLQTYIGQYRMLTDSLTIKSAYIVNIGVNFDITLRPDYSARETIANCLTQLKSYFSIDNWQINQPIILSEVYTLLDQVDGVQTVKSVAISNLSAADGDYSQYSYDIQAATLNGVIYPSLDPSIFEVKFPDIDIRGRVVTM